MRASSFPFKRSSTGSTVWSISVPSTFSLPTLLTSIWRRSSAIPNSSKALGVGPGFFGPLVESFNDQLSDALDAFEKDAHVDVKELDLNTLFDAIVANPIAYGFTNVDEPVLINPPVPGSTPIYNPAIVGQDPLVEHGTLFLDPFFHPTALGHSVIAETARNALLDLPEGMDGSGKELFMTFVSESSPADSAIGYYFYDLPGDGKLAAGATVDGGIGEGFIAFTSTETTPAGTEVRIEVADGAGVAPFLLKNVGDVDLDLSAFKNGGLTFSQAGGEASVFFPDRTHSPRRWHCDRSTAPARSRWQSNGHGQSAEPQWRDTGAVPKSR